MISIIYKLTHTPTGKFYIGSLRDAKKFETYNTSSKYVKPMIEKAPGEWVREILKSYENTPFSDVVRVEQAMIEESVKLLGWEGVWNRFYHSGVAECYSPKSREKAIASLNTQEAIAKMSASIRKRFKEDPTYRAKLSAITTEQMKDPAMKAAVAKANSERIHSEETKRRLSESHKGILHTLESKNKIGTSKIGRRLMVSSKGERNYVKAEEFEQRLKEGWNFP